MRRAASYLALAVLCGCDPSVSTGTLQPLQVPATEFPFAPPPAPRSQSQQIRETQNAIPAVVRVLCVQPAGTAAIGTGWFHASGKVVTAAHVVEGCSPPGQVKLGVIARPQGTVTMNTVDVTASASDRELDLTLLTVQGVTVPGLNVGVRKNLDWGDVVVTWGYPGGYPGIVPLLTVGHIAGQAPANGLEGTKPRVRLWVNAAFNRGNSGGPLIDAETGTVIGVIHAKLAEPNPTAESAWQALKNQRSGFVYNAKDANGKEVTFSEAQVTAMFLEHLRNQVQLVIGMSVTTADLRAFLEKNGITP
jgi:S1-C subfamily serine protease